MPKGAKYGGRVKGTPNKATAEIRSLFAKMLDGLAPEVEGWIRKVAEDDPGRAADLTLKLAEFHVPKLARTEIAGDGDGEGGGLTIQVVKFGGAQ